MVEKLQTLKNKNGQTHVFGQDILSEPGEFGLIKRRNFNLEILKVINLRSFKASDENLLLLYLNNKEVTQYITNAIAQPYTISDAKWWLNTGCKSDHIKAIEYKGIFVGCIAATIGNFEYNRSAELGYWIGHEYWNRGIATEVVKEFSELLFRTTNITRLFVSVVSQNTASIRVLEKNGFKFEGLLEKASFKNNQFYDECLLSKIG